MVSVHVQPVISPNCENLHDTCIFSHTGAQVCSDIIQFSCLACKVQALGFCTMVERLVQPQDLFYSGKQCVLQKILVANTI